VLIFIFLFLFKASNPTLPSDVPVVVYSLIESLFKMDYRTEGIKSTIFLVFKV